MKDPKKENLLYFEDDEILTGKTDAKKVFVTKRINGKETHVKQKKEKTTEKPKETEYKRVPNTQGFNFEREIVIGVNSKRSKNNNSFNNSNQKKKKSLPKEKSEGKHSKDIKKRKKHASSKKEKPKKIRKTNKVFITIISILTMSIAILIMALVTPTFNIKEIRVFGNDKVTTANIINLSGLKIGQNIFRNNKNKIKKAISENTYVDDVQIKRVLPGTIDLTITERKPMYQVKLISSYIIIDKKGNILENSENKENAILIEGIQTPEEELINGKKLRDVDIEKLVKTSNIKEKLGEIEGLDLSDVKINIKNEKDFIIYLKSENKKIYIGDDSNLSNKLLYIKKILENEKDNSGTIFINGDLNSGFKPYFREEEYKE